jgi:cobalt-zinc-cadmium efflux system outer membrane protein
MGRRQFTARFGGLSSARQSTDNSTFPLRQPKVLRLFSISTISRPPNGFRASVCSGLVAAALVAGCHAGHPSDEQIGHVNTLVNGRMDADWDVKRLFDDSDKVVEPTGELTLRRATDVALRHNLSLIASGENLSIAHAQLVQAGLIQNPSLGQSNGFIFPINPHAGLPSIDGNITQVLNGIFTQPGKVSVARVQEVEANLDMATQAYTLAQTVDGKYQEMVHLVRARALLVKIQGYYGRAVQAAEARQKVGVIPTPELNRARLDYADATRQVRHVTTQYDRAAREMNWLMGFSTAPKWKLPDVASAEVSNIPDSLDVDRLEKLGLQFRLDLARADLDNRIGERELGLAELGMIPEVTAGVEIQRDGSHNLFGGPFIPTLTLPIFDPGFVAVELARAQLRKSQKTYAALEGQVRQDVRTALDNWRIAADDVQFFKQHLIPQQEENVRLMELSFSLGNDDLDTLLNVYQNYVTQLQAFEDALQAYHDATVALQQAIGLSWDRILAATPGSGTTRPATTGPVTADPAAGSGPTTAPASGETASIQPQTTRPATTGPASEQNQ